MIEKSKITQEDIIINYLTHDWMFSYELQKVNTPYGWLGTSADRIARRMAEQGKKERQRVGKYAQYRLITGKLF
jgi:hypothetical protein